MAMNRYPARRSSSQPSTFGDWSDFFSGFGFPGFFERTLSTGAMAPVDVCERGDSFVIRMACAGCRSEDIDVTVEEDVVRIRGQFPQHTHGMPEASGGEQSGGGQGGTMAAGGQPQGGQGSQQSSSHGSPSMPSGGSGGQRGMEGQREVCLIRELPTGRFERDIALPMGVEAQEADAHFENGLLTLTLPKARAAMGHRIQIGGGSTASSGQQSEGGSHRARSAGSH